MLTIMEIKIKVPKEDLDELLNKMYKKMESRGFILNETIGLPEEFIKQLESIGIYIEGVL